MVWLLGFRVQTLRVRIQDTGVACVQLRGCKFDVWSDHSETSLISSSAALNYCSELVIL